MMLSYWSFRTKTEHTPTPHTISFCPLSFITPMSTFYLPPRLVLDFSVIVLKLEYPTKFRSSLFLGHFFFSQNPRSRPQVFLSVTSSPWPYVPTQYGVSDSRVTHTHTHCLVTHDHDPQSHRHTVWHQQKEPGLPRSRSGVAQRVPRRNQNPEGNTEFLIKWLTTLINTWPWTVMMLSYSGYIVYRTPLCHDHRSLERNPVQVSVTPSC